MTSSWRYEFKKGKEVRCYANPTREDYCVHRNLLQEGHRKCGVEVYDLLTGPMNNPIREVVEVHTNRRLLSKPGVPEGGGICKYVKPSETEFCKFCNVEAAKSREKVLIEKEQKRIREMNYLMKNLHRIRGTPVPEDNNNQVDFFEQSDYNSNEVVLRSNETKQSLKRLVYFPSSITGKGNYVCKDSVQEICAQPHKCYKDNFESTKLVQCHFCHPQIKFRDACCQCGQRYSEKCST